MVELYLHSYIRFHGVVLNYAQGQIYLYLYISCKIVSKLYYLKFCMSVNLVSYPRGRSVLRVFENRMVIRIFGPKRKIVICILHNLCF
jgi:hypothetical protein